MFEEEKKLDAMYRDYEYAKRLVKEHFTAEDVLGARCITVNAYLVHKLNEKGEPLVDPRLVQRAVHDCFGMILRKCSTPSGELYLYFKN